MKKADEIKQEYVEEWISVGDLEIDHDIQRYVLNLRKVENIIKHWNPRALGVIIVSRRNPVTMVVLDGMHRVQAFKELSDNQGKILCHVYEGLSRAEEAQMFLDLNAGNQPNLLEKFKAKMVVGDPVALGVTSVIRGYGWSIDPTTANGNIQCVGALERIYTRSQEMDKEPNLLQLAIMCVTRAWELERIGAQASILEGLATLFAEHGDNVEVDRVIEKLAQYKGGPRGLQSDATNMAALRRGRVPIAVAELLIEEYNKGKQSKRLTPIRKRRL